MAVFNDFPVAAPSFGFVTSYYRALVDGAEYEEGQILRATAQFDTATGQLTGIVTWFNLDAGTAMMAPPANQADVGALDNSRIILGTEALFVTAVADPLGGIPPSANYAEAHVWNADVVVTVDGTTPSAATGNGFRQANGQMFALESREELEGFQAVRLGAADAKIYLTYFRVFGGDLVDN